MCPWYRRTKKTLHFIYHTRTRDSQRCIHIAMVWCSFTVYIISSTYQSNSDWHANDFSKFIYFEHWHIAASHLTIIAKRLTSTYDNKEYCIISIDWQIETTFPLEWKQRLLPFKYYDYGLRREETLDQLIWMLRVMTVFLTWDRCIYLYMSFLFWVQRAFYMSEEDLL